MIDGQPPQQLHGLGALKTQKPYRANTKLATFKALASSTIGWEANVKIHERMAFAAIVNGLKEGGVIDDATVAIIARKLRQAIPRAQTFGPGEAAYLELLAVEIEAGRDGGLVL